MNLSANNLRCDVLIQGGGPVGLACAAWCLQQLPTLKLVLLDRNPSADEALSNGNICSDTRGIALSHGSKLLLKHGHLSVLKFIEYTYRKRVALVAPS